MPAALKKMKTAVESATVTPIVPVPGLQPGMRPRMLFMRMKKKTVARNGKYFGPWWPIIAVGDVVANELRERLDRVRELVVRERARASGPR